MKTLNPRLESNLQQIVDALGNSTDLVIRRFHIGLCDSIQTGIVYMQGLAKSEAVDRIMEALFIHTRSTSIRLHDKVGPNIIRFFKDSILPVGGMKETDDFNTLIACILSGETIILVDECDLALRVTNTQGWEKRAIEEPASQSVVRGPRRIEVVLTTIWFITIFFRLCSLFYISTIGIAQTLKLREYKFLINPLSIILIIIALISFPNVVFYQQAVLLWPIYASNFEVFLPLLILAAYVFKKMLKKYR
ncbi:spore germination protein [Cohnella silvisoli]|uniref:Spore germination protein n=1 Tax=Cohnella silvisoli TaxID=2873699 RepID=A0ABV1KZX3_9BACL|nr:spore germination protein [Cohnella silvisoli]MCD9025018.1 spore germination protein [Cohnella silvisoli]